MPWTSAESVTNEESLDEDWNRKSSVGRHCCNAEDCSNGDGSGKDEAEEENSDGAVEPNSVDWSKRRLVDALDPPRSWKTVISCVRECHLQTLV